MKSFLLRNWVPLVLTLVICCALVFVLGIWWKTPEFVTWRAAKFESSTAAKQNQQTASAPAESLLARTGQYGDMFGAANALFTGLAFSGTVIAILLQTLELKQQREEMRKSNEQFIQQNAILMDQAAAAQADREAAEERRRKESWPTLVFRTPTWGERNMAVQATNYGNVGLEVTVEVLHTEITCTRKVEEMWQPVPHDLAAKALQFLAGSAAFGPGTEFYFRMHFVTVRGEVTYRTYLAKWNERIREISESASVVIAAVGRA